MGILTQVVACRAQGREVYRCKAFHSRYGISGISLLLL